MINEDKERQELIELIRRGVEGLIKADHISETEKLAIAREALHIIENGKRIEEKGQ